MPCPISLLFINLHGSEYLVAAQLCPYGGETWRGGWESRGREKFTNMQHVQGSLYKRTLEAGHTGL